VSIWPRTRVVLVLAGRSGWRFPGESLIMDGVQKPAVLHRSLRYVLAPHRKLLFQPDTPLLLPGQSVSEHLVMLLRA
jgi:hypothetical protein